MTRAGLHDVRLRPLLLILALLVAGCAELPQAFTRQRAPPVALSLDDIEKVNENASVATTLLVVASIQNATPHSGQGSWKAPSLVTLRDPVTQRTLGMLLDTDPASQHRKRLGVPHAAMRIQAQGLVHRASNGDVLLKPTFRWAPVDHEGPTVSADDVAAGRIAEGAFVWLPPVAVQRVRHEADGDFHVELPTSSDRLVTEETPPYADSLRPPDPGETVEAYGMVLYDATHHWWELHPVYCWARDRCAPPLAALGDTAGGED